MEITIGYYLINLYSCGLVEISNENHDYRKMFNFNNINDIKLLNSMTRIVLRTESGYEPVEISFSNQDNAIKLFNLFKSYWLDLKKSPRAIANEMFDRIGDLQVALDIEDDKS